MSDTLARFTPAERAVHRAVAILMGTCLVTAAVLYNGSVMLVVGHRHTVEMVHVVAGLALPVRCCSARCRRRTAPTCGGSTG